MAAVQVTQTTKLGGTASDVQVGTVGHGLMMMTWTASPVPDEQCFASIKAGVDALPAGTKAFLNAGEFYGPNFANLELLARFFTKNPEYANKTFISVKGGVDEKLHPRGSLEFLRKSVDNITRALGPNKKLDLFEPARIDPEIPLEDLIGNLAILQKEGKFDHIGLSELKGETLRKAHAVSPIAAVEVEISPWSYEQRTKELIAAAEELNVAVIAYSPLGRGFLTGKFKSAADLPAGDFRHHLTRSKDEILQHNLKIVDQLTAVANRLGVTTAQVCLAWVNHLSPKVIPLAGSSKDTRTLENLRAGDIQLSAADVAELTAIVENHEVKGDRYFGQSEEAAFLWS